MQHMATADPHTGQRVAEATGAQQPISISRDWIILFFSLFLSPCLHLFTTPPPVLAFLPQTIAQTGLCVCLRAEVDIIFACPHVAFHYAYFNWLQPSGHHGAVIRFNTFKLPLT